MKQEKRLVRVISVRAGRQPSGASGPFFAGRYIRTRGEATSANGSRLPARVASAHAGRQPMFSRYAILGRIETENIQAEESAENTLP